GRLDRDGFPRRNARLRDHRPARARSARRRPERAIDFRGPQPVRPLDRARRRADRPGAPAGLPPDRRLSRPRGDRHEPGLIARVRFRLAVLRSSGWRGRGSGLRLGALLPGPILGIKTGPRRADRPPSLAPRRSGQGPRRWTARGADRPGGDRAQGRVAGLTAGCKGTATACCQTAILTGAVPNLGSETDQPSLTTAGNGGPFRWGNCSGSPWVQSVETGNLAAAGPPATGPTRAARNR